MTADEQKKAVKRYERTLKKNMETLGTFKAEYVHTIATFAKILVDIDAAEAEFFESGGELIVEHTNNAGVTNTIKNPYYQIIENLRQSAIIYARELGLTPAGLKKLNDKLKAAPEKKENTMKKILSLYG